MGEVDNLSAEGGYFIVSAYCVSAYCVSAMLAGGSRLQRMRTYETLHWYGRTALYSTLLPTVFLVDFLIYRTMLVL